MDSVFVYKVAPRGEGKTRWLLDASLNLSEGGKQIFLATTNTFEYARFVDKFFSLFNKVCPVQHTTDFKNVTQDSVVLIDDLLSSGIDLNEVIELQYKCSNVYITLEGTIGRKKRGDTRGVSTEPYEQLTMDGI